MTQTRPRGLDGKQARRLLSQTKDLRTVSDRVTRLSGLLLGRPYVAGALVGSAETPEVFTVSLDAFDCVTYLETVLALALASDARGFAEELRRIRYEEGQVEWTRRNHYMTGWIRANTPGFVRPLAAGPRASRKERLLDAVPGMPPKRAVFVCLPKARIRDLEPRLRSGDLIFFASTRKDLDVFHCGILVEDRPRWLLRHAARSKGAVVEQDLREFLKANRMAGVLVARPLGEAEDRERERVRVRERVRG